MIVCKKALVEILIVCFAAFAGAAVIHRHHHLPHSGRVDLRLQDNGPGSCVLVNCFKPFALCMLDTQCRQAIICDENCLNKANKESCNLLCELTYGYNSSKYREVLQCMSDHGCLPTSPPDGKCLAQDTDTVKNLTNLAQVKGKWWILRGLNCGQLGWPAGFDYFPCQQDHFVFQNA